MSDKKVETADIEVSTSTVKSLSASDGYKVVRAITTESYDPQSIGDLFQEQRKKSFAYAKLLVSN